jgi:hypothetical protein
VANTPAQNQAAITTAIQAAAAADLALLQTFGVANSPGFNTLETNLTNLATQMSSLSRQQQVQGINAALMHVLGQFNTLISTTTDAKTSVPVA